VNLRYMRGLVLGEGHKPVEPFVVIRCEGQGCVKWTPSVIQSPIGQVKRVAEFTCNDHWGEK